MRPTPVRLRRVLAEDLRRLLDAAVAAALARGLALWAVGGCVRDVALSVPPGEVDLAVDGDVEPIARSAAAALGLPRGAVRFEPRFGTASVELAGGAGRLDLSRLRTERYARPGALPEVRFSATIEQDLRRRDFTVNAVALLLSAPGEGPRAGVVVDPLSGIADLEAGVLRALHPRSFADDATRIWRGARYAARFSLRPDPPTRRLIEEGARHLAPVSGHRLWSELERLAGERRVGAALALLAGWGALSGTHPGLGAEGGALRALRRRRGPLPADLLVALLLAESPARARAGVLRRLSSPRGARLAVEGASTLLEAGRRDESPPEPAELEQLAATTESGRRAARWLDPVRQRPLQRPLRRWERTSPPLAARELMALGVERGPEIGRLLALLRRERYLGTLRGAAQARARVRSELDAARRSEG